MWNLSFIYQRMVLCKTFFFFQRFCLLFVIMCLYVLRVGDCVCKIISQLWAVHHGLGTKLRSSEAVHTLRQWAISPTQTDFFKSKIKNKLYVYFFLINRFFIAHTYINIQKYGKHRNGEVNEICLISLIKSFVIYFIKLWNQIYKDKQICDFPICVAIEAN